MKVFKIFGIGTIAMFFSCSAGPLRLVPLTQFNYVDSTLTKGSRWKMKYTNFIIENYANNEKTDKAIDSMINATVVEDFSKFETYRIALYKSSKITNVAHLKENPKDLDRYTRQNDWVYDYTWIRGVFAGRFKIEDGKFIKIDPNK